MNNTKSFQIYCCVDVAKKKKRKEERRSVAIFHHHPIMCFSPIAISVQFLMLVLHTSYI